MSVRSESAPCRYCGSVGLVAAMVRLVDEEYAYACDNCAVREKVPR